MGKGWWSPCAAPQWGDHVGEDPACNLMMNPPLGAKWSLHGSAQDASWVNCLDWSGQEVVPEAGMGGHRAQSPQRVLTQHGNQVRTDQLEPILLFAQSLIAKAIYFAITVHYSQQCYPGCLSWDLPNPVKPGFSSCQNLEQSQNAPAAASQAVAMGMMPRPLSVEPLLPAQVGEDASHREGCPGLSTEL